MCGFCVCVFVICFAGKVDKNVHLNTIFSALFDSLQTLTSKPHSEDKIEFCGLELCQRKSALFSSAPGIWLITLTSTYTWIVFFLTRLRESSRTEHKPRNWTREKKRWGWWVQSLVGKKHRPGEVGSTR